MATRTTPTKAQLKRKPVRKKPSVPMVDVNITIKMKKTEIESEIAEAVINELYNGFRGYGAKPKVSITVAGNKVI